MSEVRVLAGELKLKSPVVNAAGLFNFNSLSAMKFEVILRATY